MLLFLSVADSNMCTHHMISAWTLFTLVTAQAVMGHPVSLNVPSRHTFIRHPFFNFRNYQQAVSRQNANSETWQQAFIPAINGHNTPKYSVLGYFRDYVPRSISDKPASFEDNPSSPIHMPNYLINNPELSLHTFSHDPERFDTVLVQEKQSRAHAIKRAQIDDQTCDVVCETCASRMSKRWSALCSVQCRRRQGGSALDACLTLIAILTSSTPPN